MTTYDCTKRPLTPAERALLTEADLVRSELFAGDWQEEWPESSKLWPVDVYIGEEEG